MQNLIQAITRGELDETFQKIYSNDQELDKIRKRYIDVIKDLNREFPETDDEIRLYSAPGRTEIGGNHTDHQLGVIIAGSVDRDMIAAARKNNSDKIRIYSDGYGKSEVDITNTSIKEYEKGKAAALIRGICKRLDDLGYDIGGFDAYINSGIPSGSGISSSAAFEILILTILNDLFCDNEISPVQQAQIGQNAENVYFGKPSGLMDQLACAIGGIVKIDFSDPEKPQIEKVDVKLKDNGYSLYIIDSMGSHEDLTDEYAAIPEEMKRIAHYFNAEVLSQVDREEFFKNLKELRENFKDREVLRAIHFFKDSERAELMAKSLQENDFNQFLKLVNESGNSSVLALQNIWPSAEIKDQGLAFALTLAEDILNGKGASRVHGGGFAGTIQAYVPVELEDDFVERMNSMIGPDACMKTSIRLFGGIKVK